MINAIVVHHCGLKDYRKARPFFLGPILGEMTMAVILTRGDAIWHIPAPYILVEICRVGSGRAERASPAATNSDWRRDQRGIGMGSTVAEGLFGTAVPNESVPSSDGRIAQGRREVKGLSEVADRAAGLLCAGGRCDNRFTVVSRGVVGGYGDGTYRPAVVCTRDQMAVFVARAFGLPI